MGRLRSQFDQIARKILPDRRAQSQAFHDAGRAWAAEVRTRLPRSLAAGVRWEEQGARQGNLLMPMAAWYRETGTKAHTIRPKSKNALSFFWGAPNAPHAQHGTEGPGRYALAKVNHPGQRARPFLDDAWASERVQSLLSNVDGRIHRNG